MKKQPVFLEFLSFLALCLALAACRNPTDNTPITYTIAYDKNAADATGTMENSSHTINVAKNLDLNAFTWTGYTFSGWARTSTGEVEFTDGQSVKNLNTVAGETITLYAVWVASSNFWTVKFETYNGSAIGDAIVLRNTTVSRPVPDPTRTGYSSFSGWFTDEELTTVYNFSSIVIKDITLYAKWTPITYTVAYNKNAADAIGIMAVSSHTYDIEKNLNTKTFTYTGHAFVGWARLATGAMEFTDGQSVKNLTTTSGATVTLYAQWTNIQGSGVINVPFTGPTERIITITRVITNNLSQSGGGSVTLKINESFDRYEWFVGTTHIANGNNVTLQAANTVFIPGHNWITAVVYTGTGADAIPWSGEFVVQVNE